MADGQVRPQSSSVSRLLPLCLSCKQKNEKAMGKGWARDVDLAWPVDGGLQIHLAKLDESSTLCGIQSN